MPRLLLRILVVAGSLLLSGVAVTADEGDLSFGVLALRPSFDSLYVRSGELVIVDMDVWALEQEVKACQAFLGYNDFYLAAVDVAPGGGAWDDLIYQEISFPGEIDTAIGVYGESTAGTSASGTVAVITLVAGPNEGVTRLIFRPDVSDIESTFLSSMDARIVWPTTLASQFIVIDNTPPTIVISSAEQLGQELIGSGVNAIQGTVDISVTASDSLAGLFGHPGVTVTPDGGAAEDAVFVSEIPVGTFNYTWTVTSGTPNGAAVIEASVPDKAGNLAVAAPRSFNVNKNRITGNIELDSFVGSSRAVTFVATGGTQAEWTVLVSGFSGSVAGFTLDDVPEGTTALSAKTDWNLRSKVSLADLGNGQTTAELTGADLLPGGDLDDSNTVNVTDYTIMKTNWFTTNAVADITGDGAVNVWDYTVMKLNWFEVGDAE